MLVSRHGLRETCTAAAATEAEGDHPAVGGRPFNITPGAQWKSEADATLLSLLLLRRIIRQLLEITIHYS